MVKNPEKISEVFLTNLYDLCVSFSMRIIQHTEVNFVTSKALSAT